MTKIKDIYAGKPDAKDEVETVGFDSFIENYVLPDDFNKEALVNGTSYYITGYKGTGKTALLYYLDSYIREKDEQTCSSFIFFKGDFSDIKKQEMQQLSSRLFSSISIENDVILEGDDFEYVWRWLLYNRIIEDNQNNQFGLYRNSRTWSEFEKVLSQIEYRIKKRRSLSIPKKVHLECKMQGPSSGITVSPSADLDFSNSKVEKTDAYRLFVSVIDRADELFELLSLNDRTDIPYYIFVDELEAYYGKDDVFRRDLHLIRDLIFTVKRLNQIMGRYKSVKTKIICSVRSEIIGSINRFVVTKELNKVTSGFETPLKWDYKTTNSYKHPIIKILTKRIQYADNSYQSDKALFEKWFPEKINEVDPANYILNNSWCKPRDIVRLILSAQNCLAAENDSFSQNTIDMCKKQYSKDSLDEIKEEMRALYSAEDIDLIMNCLTGFKKIFSFKEIQDRVNIFFEGTFLKEKLSNVLNDLYRLGIIGNYMSGSYRWQHKGDDTIIFDNNWRIIIHPALQSALSVNSKQDSVLERRHPRSGENIDVMIKRITGNSVYGEFIYGMRTYKTFMYIENTTSIKVNKNYLATLLKYDKKHHDWIIRLTNLENK